VLPDNGCMELYRVAPGVSFRHWEGEETAVVRSEGAGRTHLVSPESIWLLEAFAGKPEGMSPHEVAAVLFGPDVDPDSTEWLEQTLAALNQAGLLSSVETDGDAG
jgi:hypothetical protein